MSVELEPVELGFRRPFTHEVSQTLRLRNPNTDPVAFKVKTTAPKQYCVRPNSGRIETGQEVEVQVLLQAMKEDPPPDAKCRDKFLVQSVAITADKESGSTSAIWSQIESTAKGSIQEKKIRVVFLPAEGAAVSTPSKQPNGTHHLDEPSTYGSPEAASPSRQSSAPAVGSVSKPESRPEDAKDLGQIRESAYNPADSSQSALGSAARGVANAIPTSSDDLKAQLREAQTEISRLTRQIQEQGLRQRKTDAVNQDSQERITTGTTGMGIQRTPASGVPVQITAGLCLLAFLLAYIFF
ncbi:MAG: phosphatidylinositol-binding protein scs2 [Bogoriella megaspora]|nr:MAG: phosphatidylinositol-binding protein scs2 [Bogoriella megaspora]